MVLHLEATVERRFLSLFVKCIYLLVFFADILPFQVFIVYVVFFLFFPTCRPMCNTNMSVSTEGAAGTSQIPASEQETLVGISVFSV